MDTKIGTYAVVVTLIIAAAIIGAALINSPNIIPQPEKKTIMSDGTYTASIPPNKVEVTFSIVTNGTTASDAQTKNTQASDKVIAALKAKGYKDSDISTVYYNVYPEYNWSSGSNDIIGYTATHQIKVNNSNISAAGSIVDIAVKNGANQVDYIDFGLTSDAENTYRVEALGKASQNARDKADAIAKGLGLSIKGIVSVSEGNVYYPPYRFDYMAAESAVGGGVTGKQVSITPGNVDVSASVSVTFEIG